MITDRQYSCSAEGRPIYRGYTRADVTLAERFTEWRYAGDPNNRTYRSIVEIWHKAEECMEMAQSSSCRRYFKNVANKYRRKYLRGEL